MRTLTPAASGSGPIQERTAYVSTSNHNVFAASSVALASSDAGAIDTTVAAHGGRRLINLKPLGGAVELGQVENRTYRLAGNVTDIRRKFMRIAVADGVVTAQEDAISQDLQALEVALEQKADDERAAFALIRAGRTKHTRGIVVDLFPAIGPNEAA